MKNVTPRMSAIESLIVYHLENETSLHARAAEAFSRVKQYFVTSDYLLGTDHSAILGRLYSHEFEFNTVKEVAARLGISRNTLLCSRKKYLQLFAKYFLNTKTASAENFGLLFSALRTYSA